MKIFGKKVSKVTIAFMLLGAAAIAVTALLLSACLSPDGGGTAQIGEFIERFSYFKEHFGEIFRKEYAGRLFLIILLLLEAIYAMCMLGVLLMPGKYIRGREYGSAEWGNLSEVNDKLASKNPEDKFKLFYEKEPAGKKFFRKLFENKRKYVR